MASGFPKLPGFAPTQPIEVRFICFNEAFF